MWTRRLFLASGAVALFGGQGARRKRVLVTVFQRGAVDGLNMIVPHGEAQYYALRPGIAVPRGEVLDLDGFFGLHPSMAALKPVWDAGALAVVTAAGSPDPTRSHFDAQDYMESGTPGVKSTRDGWLNRALPGSPREASPVRAVAVGTTLPRTLRGANPAIAVADLGSFRVEDMALEAAYAKARDRQMAEAGRETFEAVRLLRSVPAHGGRPYPNGRLGRGLQQIARLIQADVGLEAAFADMGGWDTHVNEPAQLANLLREFSEALAAFWRDLGDRAEDVVVVTLSEFGRTARENGNRGADHGHGNAMLLLGGPVKGGKVYGDWPGLAPEQLYEGRDLAVTTDFRDVLAEVVVKHLKTADAAAVFPGYARPKFRGVLKA